MQQDRAAGKANTKRAAKALGTEPSARPVLDFAMYVPALLIHTSNKMSTGANALYRRCFGIGVTEWRVLALLAAEPGSSAQRICEMIGFDKAIVSRVVKSLHAEGRVQITADAKDSRKHKIALTPRGRQLHNQIISVALERERRLLTGIDPKDVQLLRDILRKLHGNLPLADSYDPAEFEPARME